jgi:hypothetical protein
VNTAACELQKRRFGARRPAGYEPKRVLDDELNGPPKQAQAREPDEVGSSVIGERPLIGRAPDRGTHRTGADQRAPHAAYYVARQ